MSAPSDDMNEMRTQRQIDDATAEAVLRGDVVVPEFRPVAEFVQDVKAAGTVRVAPSRELAQRMATGDFSGIEPVAPPGSVGRQTRRRRMAGMGARARFATGMAVVLTACTGVTMAGAWPDGAQRTVDSIIKTVLPFTADERDESDEIADDVDTESPGVLEPAADPEPYSGIGRAEQSGESGRSASGTSEDELPASRPSDHPGRGDSDGKGSPGQKPSEHPGQGNSNGKGSPGQKPSEHPGQGNSSGQSSSADQTGGKSESRSAVRRR